MSPRPKRFRRMNQPPFIKGFKPFGSPAESEPVKVLYEEYEAIKLADYENLSQEVASERMNISRPTFTRIYDSARKKIAKAFLETRSIIIDGGNVHFEDNWYRCKNCESTFKKPIDNDKVTECPVCLSKDIIHINATIRSEQDIINEKRQGQGGRGREDFCICPKCQNRISHQPGVPCRSVICPECGVSMIREHSRFHNDFIRKKFK